jgi:SAM-dependent methyltransferase
VTDLEALYNVRFSDRDRRAKEAIWRVLCECFFQRFAPEDSVVLDLACGFGEFSRYIRAARKIAVDTNPDVETILAGDVEFHHGSADDLSMIGDEEIDVCFTSNFFEHLPDKPAMDRVLKEVLERLRRGALDPPLRPVLDEVALPAASGPGAALPQAPLGVAAARKAVRDRGAQAAGSVASEPGSPFSTNRRAVVVVLPVDAPTVLRAGPLGRREKVTRRLEAAGRIRRHPLRVALPRPPCRRS